MSAREIGAEPSTDAGPAGNAGPAGERAPRKRGGPRSCYGKNGKPKASFTTKKQAEKAIPRTSTGLSAYRCERHGWHLGH